VYRLLKPALRGDPDRLRSVANYERLAPDYESTTLRIRHIRRAAIEALAPRPGETVYDIGCGAGATLADLADAVGPGGRVLGVEHSPHMARLARERAAPYGVRVEVLECAVSKMPARPEADAMLLCYTHDILQAPAAIERLAEVAKPGCRIAIAGMRFLPWSVGFAINAIFAFRARHYLTTFRGLDDPMAGIAPYCPDLRVIRSFHCGTSYLAAGTFSRGRHGC
jgi:ubiquinone/menaquinone biosynthesis C-methylase UbiE